jgi:dTDP-4-amino-4,6-dideoxygalactose transaminase
MHYGGYPADLEQLGTLAAQHGLALIEDAAHAPAVRYRGGQRGTALLGTVGDVGCFSFHATKNVAAGEGGVVVARDSAVLTRCRELRSHCMTASAWHRDRGLALSYDVTGLGFNYRPTDVAAAVARVQLGRLGSDRVARAAVVTQYRGRFGAVSGLVLPFAGRGDADTAHHLFPVVLPPQVDRTGFRAALHAAGVQTSVHYPPTHHLSYYRDRSIVGAALPVTDAVAGRLVSLPLHARMSEADAGYVADVVVSALERAGRA